MFCSRNAGRWSWPPDFLTACIWGIRRFCAGPRPRRAAGSGAAWVLTFNTHPLKVLAAPESAPLLLTGLPHKLRASSRPWAWMGASRCRLTPRWPHARRKHSLPNWRPPRPPGRGLRGQQLDFRPRRRRGPALLRTLAASTDSARWSCPRFAARARRCPARASGAPWLTAAWRPPPSCWAGLSACSGRGRRPRPPPGHTDRQPGHSRRGPAAAGGYAVRVLLGCRRLRGWPMSAGADHGPGRRGCGGSPLLVETHILDFGEDIYGLEMEVCFLRRLRPERRFDSPAQLRGQIIRDIDKVRAWFPRRPGVNLRKFIALHGRGFFLECTPTKQIKA